MAHKLSYLGIFAVSWAVADFLFPLLISLAKRIGAVDKPGGHKTQKTPVPFLGGIGIFLSLTITLLLTLRFDQLQRWYPLAGIPLGGIFVLALGILDDWRPLNAVLKLLLLFLGSLVVLAFGIGANLFPGSWGIIPNILVSMLWIAGITSAMNSLDNTDGVTGGVSAIAAGALCVLSLLKPQVLNQPYITALAFALLGSTLAFLRYNWPEAKIYLGDNGSFFLGFVMSSSLLFAGWNQDPIKAAIAPVVLLTVPLLDLGLSTLLRYANGVVKTWREAVVYCGHDHLAHRLQKMGFSKKGACLALWALSAYCAAQALLLCMIENDTTFWCAVGGHCVFVCTLSALLAKAPVYSRNQLKNPVLPVEGLPGILTSHLHVLIAEVKAEEEAISYDFSHSESSSCSRELSLWAS